MELTGRIIAEILGNRFNAKCPDFVQAKAL